MFNIWRLPDLCPSCMKTELESMRISLDETYKFDYDADRGVTLEFRTYKWYLKLRLENEESSSICTRMEGFSLYENTILNVSIRYPSNWNKQEILLNNDHGVLQVMFALPIAARFSKTEDSETISEKIRDIMYNQSSTVVILSLKKLPVRETSTLQAITNDHIHALQICFDNVNLLKTSYDYNMAEIPASIIYTCTDPLQNQSNKQGIQIISVKSHKEITITYNSQIQDFERFLPTVNKMISTFSIGL